MRLLDCGVPTLKRLIIALALSCSIYLLAVFTAHWMTCLASLNIGSIKDTVVALRTGDGSDVFRQALPTYARSQVAFVGDGFFAVYRRRGHAQPHACAADDRLD
jgi:hypothetical protein